MMQLPLKTQHLHFILFIVSVLVSLPLSWGEPFGFAYLNAEAGESQDESKSEIVEFAEQPLITIEAIKPRDRLTPIYFTYGCNEDLLDRQLKFHTSSQEILQAIASWLKAHPSINVEIRGHCDERGTNNYNFGPASRRAAHIKSLLVNLGVDEGQLQFNGYGESKPVCTVSNEACWNQNNRVDFKVNN